MRSERSSHDIRLEGVSKIYPRSSKPAVDSVCLDIADGEFITLLGPSGSGKTTTLSMIAGFTSLTEGEIFLGGNDIGRLKPHRRNLGVVFQQYALFPHMTVKENITYPLRQRRLSRAEINDRVNQVLELVSLSSLSDRFPRELSGGQQQRVALARAVVYEPGALLLDEPLGALDKKLRDGLQRQIARMHKELGMTFIFVTHDQDEALTLSDRIAVFNDGIIEQVGSPTMLYESPETLFVAEFLGESNVFDGTVSSDGRFESGLFGTDVGARAAQRVSGAALVVRPERVLLGQSTDAAIGIGPVLQAFVTDIRYLGSHYRIGLRFNDGRTGSAMQLVGAATAPEIGATVAVSWLPEHQRVVATNPQVNASPAVSPTATTDHVGVSAGT